MSVVRISPVLAVNPVRPLTEQVVLAVPQLAEAEATGRVLRRAGSEVFCVSTSEEARRLVRAGVVTTAVLATDLPGESGWLTCAKLQWSHPEVRILLVGPDTALNRRKAQFVGAAALLPDAAAVVAALRPVGRFRAGSLN